MKSASQRDPVVDAEWPKPVAPGLEISATIRRECTGDLCARRGMPAWKRMVASLALSLGVFGVLAFLTQDRVRVSGTFRDALFGAAGWGVVQALVLWAGVVQPPGRRVSPAIRLALAVTLPVLFLLYVGYAAPEWVSFGQFSEGARAQHAVRCSLVGLLFGAMVSGGILLLWRGTDPLTPGLTGALLGLVGGVGGGLAIGIACPSQEGWHACVSHGLGALIFVGFGWAVGRRLLSP
jgi:hypothetical protein